MSDVIRLPIRDSAMAGCGACTFHWPSEIASTTNTPPTITRVSGCCTMKAIMPIKPPSAREPVSPMKSSAG